METIFIQPIFAPDKKRFDRNMDSLTSFFNYCKEYKYDIKFAVGGWCEDQYWPKFVELINGQNAANKICLMRFERNYGKAIIVNKLYENIKTKGIDFKYILTADSDILFPLETKNMVERLEDVAVKSVEFRKVPFGLCGLQQLSHGCHFTSINENKYSFKNILGEEEHIVYPTAPSGIAGGCLFLSREFWEKADGYRVFGSYSCDDADLLIRTKQLGTSWQVSLDIGIIHPFEDDEAYQKIKIEVCQRTARSGIKQNIDKEIQELEDFWKEHKQ